MARSPGAAASGACWATAQGGPASRSTSTPTAGWARHGAQVVVTGRNESRVSAVVKKCLEVSPKKLKALQVIGDVSKDEDAKKLVEETIKNFGRLDVLVNNAGMMEMGTICD